MAVTIPPQAAGAVAQQIAPAAEGNFMDMFASTPLGLALLQGGLSATSGTPLGQAFGQGLGVYQQLMANQANQEAGKAQAAIEARKIAQKDRELDIKEKGLGKEGKAAPTGVDDKIWKQALDTVMAGQEDFDAVDVSEVYRMYNTMAPEGQKAYMPASSGTMTATLEAMAANPDYATEYLNTYGSIYGDSATKRLTAAWQKRQQAPADEPANEEAAAEEEAGLLSSLASMLPNFGTQAPAPMPQVNPMTTPMAQSALQQMVAPRPASAFNQMQSPEAAAALQMMMQGNQ